MNKNIFVCIVVCMFSLTSCWVNKQVVTNPPKYMGNVYKKMEGKSKNYILQSLSAPDKITSDGNGGEILVYEKKTTITNTTAAATSSSYTNSAVVSGYDIYYGNPAAVGASKTKSGYDYASQTVTSEKKTYIHFFINSYGKCYRVNTNVGNIYSPAETTCVRVANKDLLWTLIPPATIFVGIPVSIWYACNKNKRLPCQ